jgi:hypothetical protein
MSATQSRFHLSPRAATLLAAAILAPVLLTLWAGGAAGPPSARAKDDPAKTNKGTFNPVPLPDPAIPDFQFPESEATILGWVADSASSDPMVQSAALANIYRHVWGIWTALNVDSGEKYLGDNLRVFETWFTPQDLLTVPAGAKLSAVRERNPRPLTQPHQLRILERKQKAAPRQETVLGFVKYDPTGAHHIVQQKLLHQPVLDSLLDNGRTDVVAFPVTAVSLKPVYQPLGSGKMLSGNPALMVDGRYYPMNVWPGPPTTPRAFPSQLWNTWAWIDVKGGGTGDGSVVTTTGTTGQPPDPGTIKPNVTYSVDQFIKFKLKSQADVDQINQAAQQAFMQFGAAADTPLVQVNDEAVLLAMHVTSRETVLWTWQTFWWSANDAQPFLPSSAAIAQARPAQLKDAARHYAAAPAYSMVLPMQPVTGGINTGQSVYAYNPYLEAGFGPSVLPASIIGQSGTQVVLNNVGVQTNCMSCHAMASYARGGAVNLQNTLYTGDRYVDIQGNMFRGNLRTDFLWSIPQNAAAK